MSLLLTAESLQWWLWDDGLWQTVPDWSCGNCGYLLNRPTRTCLLVSTFAVQGSPMPNHSLLCGARCPSAAFHWLSPEQPIRYHSWEIEVKYVDVELGTKPHAGGRAGLCASSTNFMWRVRDEMCLLLITESTFWTQSWTWWRSTLATWKRTWKNAHSSCWRKNAKPIDCSIDFCLRESAVKFA